jgi:hypothetical protein
VDGFGVNRDLRATTMMRDQKQERGPHLVWRFTRPYHQDVTSIRTKRIRYFARLFTVGCTAVFGILFLASISVLGWVYFGHTPHRFPLFVTTRDFFETAMFGAGFVFIGIAYFRLLKTSGERR